MLTAAGEAVISLFDKVVSRNRCMSRVGGRSDETWLRKSLKEEVEGIERETVFGKDSPENEERRILIVEAMMMMMMMMLSLRSSD